MYNGIGLKTARGTGTNGYVTRNLSFVKPKNAGFKPYDYDKAAPVSKSRTPNDDVLLHKSKRQIEVECLELREKLEAQKYQGILYAYSNRTRSVEENDIERQVKRLRAELQAKLQDKIHGMKEDVLMERKEREMKRIKSAFGIADDFEEGRAFKFESERDRQDRLTRINEEERIKERIRY